MKKRLHLRKKGHNVHHNTKKGLVFGFNTITIITACVVLFFLGIVIINKRTVAQSVAGVGIMRGLWNEATIPLPRVSGAASYNVLYKAVSETAFTHAARHIPASSTSYTIEFLKKGTEYVYEVSAVGPTGGEYWFSNVQPITDTHSM